ncbi:MAG: hypothetical protein RL238_1260 [Actinomycetota bacterium]|jgi:iron(III) transport system ATP-binding protein
MTPFAPPSGVHDLHRRFGTVEVLRGTNLSIAPGEVTAVLGPSGGGKTTLLRLIAGFDRPDAGVVEIDGVRVAAPGTFIAPEHRRVGIVPQEGALFPHLDVAGNVGYGLRRGPDRSARVQEMLELVGMAHAASARPAQLSGGQQQRVALARALAPRPALLLLDEPFASLDATTRAQVRDEVFEMVRAAGATAVLVTHDQQEAMSVADTVAVLLDGRVAQHAAPSELYRHPVSLDVARFVGDAVVLPGRHLRGDVSTALGTTACSTSLPDGDVTVVVRPEHVALRDDDHGVAGRVVSRAYYGHDGTATVQLADGTEVTARVPADRLPGRGNEVTVAVDGPLLVFPAAPV